MPGVNNTDFRTRAAMNQTTVLHEGPVPEEYTGARLDVVVAQLVPGVSRNRLQAWLREGYVRVNGEVVTRPRTLVQAGDYLRVERPPPVSEPTIEPQSITLDVLYEDAALLVINKPAGLVVHPGAGNPDGTLQNALLHRAPELADVPRSGLVHRLDKDTSGVLVVARTLAAHTVLAAALQRREIGREYDAVVLGEMISGGTVDEPMGRHPVDRKRMAVRRDGRPAITHYRIAERYRGFTRLKVTLETGRTHQIRVHMAALGYPIVGDPVYGGRRRLPAGLPAGLREQVQGFSRQALHAKRLSLLHPETDEQLVWEAPWPDDLGALVAMLAEMAPPQ